MNFIEAAKLMKQGCKVRLGHWCENEYLHNHLDMIRDERDEEHEFSLCDVLDQGWEIYQEEPKLHTFEEAFKAYKVGKYIYSISLKEGKRSRYYGFSIHDKYKKEKEKFLIEARLINDWVIS